MPTCGMVEHNERMPGAGTHAPSTLPASGVPRVPGVPELPRVLADLIAGGFWSDIRLVVSTGSTNADVLAQAARGAPEGLVIVAEEQTAGRGRQGRSWISKPRAALMFSALLRPREVPQAARGWVPLLAGVATASALRDVPCLGRLGASRPRAGAAGSRRPCVDARLKWPNDILIGERKLGGILAEQSGDVIVVGVGVNVLGGEPDLPVPTATSLELHQVGRIDRAELLADILRQFEHWYVAWRDTCAGWAGWADADAVGAAGAGADACGLRAEYLRLSATIGQQVRVHLPGGRVLAGTATDIDGTGRLLVRADGGDTHAVSAGDVIHLR
jgi:BirA family transcriptional regulator, biotin operon repressor / biotin---[acetyl-CoA-carboxylase] ligase